MLKSIGDFFQNEVLGMKWLNRLIGNGLVANEKVVSMGKVLKAAEAEKLLHKLGY